MSESAGNTDVASGVFTLSAARRASRAARTLSARKRARAESAATESAGRGITALVESRPRRNVSVRARVVSRVGT